MKKRFNSYLDTVDIGFWRELCLRQGELRHHERGEEFITAGTVARYLGYIESGALKYECYAEDGTPHMVGLEFAGIFVTDFPFSLYGRKSRCSIVATTPCEIRCVPVSRIAEQMKTDERIRELPFSIPGIAGAQRTQSDSIVANDLVEIVVEAPKVIHNADMDVYHPSKNAVDNPKNGVQLLSNLMIPSLTVSDALAPSLLPGNPYK